MTMRLQSSSSFFLLLQPGLPASNSSRRDAFRLTLLPCLAPFTQIRLCQRGWLKPRAAPPEMDTCLGRTSPLFFSIAANRGSRGHDSRGRDVACGPRAAGGTRGNYSTAPLGQGLMRKAVVCAGLSFFLLSPPPALEPPAASPTAMTTGVFVLASGR